MPYIVNGQLSRKGKNPVARRNRPDKDGRAQSEFDKNKRHILATQEICALCGKPVDRSLKFPHPMSATIDHIIPIQKGGHPSALDNLQLAHLVCNQTKGTKLVIEANKDIQKETETISNRVLPKTIDWQNY